MCNLGFTGFFEMPCSECVVVSRRYKVLVLYSVLLLLRATDAAVLDWIWGSSKENADPRPKIGDVPAVKVPFEVASEDEKFLEEAKKYTNLKLSDLDACQHHVSEGLLMI
jgi:hypothetical protein